MAQTKLMDQTEFFFWFFFSIVSRGLLQVLEDQHVYTSTCVFHDQGLNPSSYIIHASDTGTRTIISYNK